MNSNGGEFINNLAVNVHGGWEIFPPWNPPLTTQQYNFTCFRCHTAQSARLPGKNREHPLSQQLALRVNLRPYHNLFVMECHQTTNLVVC